MAHMEIVSGQISDNSVDEYTEESISADFIMLNKRKKWKNKNGRDYGDNGNRK